MMYITLFSLNVLYIYIYMYIDNFSLKTFIMDAGNMIIRSLLLQGSVYILTVCAGNMGTAVLAGKYIYIYMFVYICAPMCTWANTYLCIYVHMYMPNTQHIRTFNITQPPIHTYMYIHIQTQTYIYIYIHTYIYSIKSSVNCG